MFEGRDIIVQKSGGPKNDDDDLYHLAHMVALLGAPPVDPLKRATLDGLGSTLTNNVRIYRQKYTPLCTARLRDSTL